MWGGGNTYPYCCSHSDAGCDRRSDGNPDSNAVAKSDRDGHCDAYAIANANSHPLAHGHPNAEANGYSHADGGDLALWRP